MAIFSEHLVNGKSAACKVDDAPQDTMRIHDAVIDLLKAPQLVYALGGFATDDNVACEPQSFKRDMPLSKPVLNAWIDSVRPYVDQDLLKDMLASGLDTMIPGYFRSAHLLMDASEKHAQVHLISHPSMEETMKQYGDINARPESFFDDHALSVVARLIGPFLASHLQLAKRRDGTWSVTGTKRPLAEVLAATRNLAFMGNSFGTNFILKSENALGYMLRELDYSPQEIRSIMTSVRAFGFSIVSPFAALEDRPDRPRFTMTGIQGINDVVAETVSPYKTMPTREEIRRFIPSAQQPKVLAAMERYRQDLKERLGNPEAQPYPPSQNPDDIENMRFLILRKIAPNRMLVMTPVPTYSQRWAFEVPGKAAQRYLEDLHSLLDAFAAAPKDRNQQAYRKAYAAQYDLLMDVMEGGADAKASANTLVRSMPAARQHQTETLLESLKARSNQYEGFMAVMKQDRAGHNMAFYQQQRDRLLRLSQRIVYNMLRYSDLTAAQQQAYRVEDMLERAPGRVPDICQSASPLSLDTMLDRDISAQTAAVAMRGAR